MPDLYQLTAPVSIHRRRPSGEWAQVAHFLARADGAIFYFGKDAADLLEVGDRIDRSSGVIYEIIHIYSDRPPGAFLRVATEPVPAQPADAPISREQVQDLIDRAKAWTGETPLDADTFSLMRQMWVMLGALMPPEPKEVLCTFCDKPIIETSIRQSKFGWRHLDGMRDFRKGMGGHDARPVDWDDPGKGPEKPPKLSKLVKQAASEQMGGYPDESLLRLYRVLKDEGL